jgi:hypothetical protein
VAPDFTDPLTARLAGFLDAIGVPVQPAPLPRHTFLPGLSLHAGRLLIDEQRLLYPGDILHEAGHVAVAPPDQRPVLDGDAETAGLDIERLEHAVVPWSYAAALHLGIDPAMVFHAGGYRGRSDRLLRTFAFGVYPGANLLEEAGMTVTGARAEALGVAPYPHMLRWLRP